MKSLIYNHNIIHTYSSFRIEKFRKQLLNKTVKASLKKKELNNEYFSKISFWT